MAWLLIGDLRRIIKRPDDSTGPKYQIQLLSTDSMKNGEEKDSIFTLFIDNPKPFEPYLGKRIILEASPWARKDGSLGVSMSDDVKIDLAEVLADTILDTRA
jgi:hypothetical protein